MKSGANDWLNSLPDPYLECRDTAIGHDWTYLTSDIVDGGYVRHFRCGRCESEKAQILDEFGHVDRNKPVYVKEYLRPHGAGRMTADDNAAVRLEHLSRNTTTTRKRRRRAS